MRIDVYTKKIIVNNNHLDALQHVNNVVFLQWVQDMAGEHWMSKSNEDFDAAHYWVVLDHYIEYKGQAFEGEEITAKTFVEKMEGVRSFRIVEFYKNEKLIVRAKTSWCLIGKERGRPRRIPEEIARLFIDDEASE